MYCIFFIIVWDIHIYLIYTKAVCVFVSISKLLYFCHH